MTNAAALHKNAIIIDAVCPLLMIKRYLGLYQTGGVTVVAPTVGGWSPSGAAMTEIGSWLELIRQRQDLVLIRTAADVRAAKRDGKTGVLLHFQGTDPVDDNLDLLNIYKSLGVGIIQLAYNVKNRVGDGALERTDCGLSDFGVNLIRRCNELGIVVDLSHTGYRTTMEAIEVNEGPIVFSHANAKAVFEVPRNIRDDQIKAVAATGGVIGAVGFPGFVSRPDRPTLEDFIAHIDHTVDIAGIDHATIALDYYTGQAGILSDEEAEEVYQGWLSTGNWSGDSYPAPPHHYPQGIETPDKLGALTEGLLKRGYSEEGVRKILGENWLRVYETVWGE